MQKTLVQESHRTPQTNNINILQWNCQSVLNKTHELLNITHNVDILILVGTWLKPQVLFRLRNYNIIRRDRLAHIGGGVYICVRKNIEYQIIKEIFNDEDSLQTVAITINFEHTQLLITAIYRPPNSRTTPENWGKLFQTLSKFPAVIAAGDYNCHHPAWGESKEAG